MITLQISASGATIIDRRPIVPVKQKRKSGPAHIYALRAGSLIKIGFAQNVSARIRQLQTGCPCKIILIASASVNHPAMIEKLWHSRLSRYNVIGEWFDIPAHDLTYVVEGIRAGIVPENPGIEFDGSIDQCAYCGNRAYIGGWCFGCGRQGAAKQRAYIPQPESAN